jgi:hypothetical protein
MAVFLEIHELAAHSAEALLAERATHADDRTRCLKNWTGDNRIALLVEAPDDYRIRAHGPRVSEVTELFASAARWAAYDAIDLAL